MLNKFDHSLFLAIHHLRNSFLDEVMPLFSGRVIWIPLYALLLFFLWRRFGKQTLMILGMIIALTVLCDQSANLLKHNVGRFRPSHDVSLSGEVITPLGPGGDYGFVSSHAANTFGLATFLWLLSGPMKGFRNVKKRWPWALLFLWSLLICWSRIYVGVHFPFDVLGGCLLGAIWGVILFVLYQKVIPVLK
ncbi:MAG: phosphatase PAP2 family protein [Bacteroidota bacterium]|nr:phosphatase PAP2 family protein [Bacteroidota bacterium]